MGLGALRAKSAHFGGIETLFRAFDPAEPVLGPQKPVLAYFSLN